MSAVKEYNQSVFLIASKAKEEEWKNFFNEITGNRIKWVKDTTDVEVCVIAMKSYIEKREETFREIEEKYSEQLKRAKQVFIFHLKTGTSYSNHLEKIKGKENWYYSVIDLDTGVPAISPHNDQVIKDFKYKLLPGIDTSDEQGLDERHLLVKKSREDNEKPSPSSGEKQNSSKRSLEISRTSWEKFCLELKTKDWNGKTVEDLNGKLKVECTGIGSKSKKKLKIIVSGNIGSGKSSLINSFMSALSGKMWNGAVECGRDDLLYSYSGVCFEHGPDLVCYEIKETHAGERKENDILKTIMEEKNDSGQTRDEDTIHVILYLVKDDKRPEYLPILNDKTENYKCLKYLVITHMDEKYPNLKNNIKAIMDNDVMGKFRDTLQRITDVPTEFILPVVNSVDTTRTMTDPYITYFLYLLLKFVNDAKEQKQKEKENNCIIM